MIQIPINVMINRVILEATLKYIKNSRRFEKTWRVSTKISTFPIATCSIWKQFITFTLYTHSTYSSALCMHNFIDYVNTKHVLVNTRSSRNKIRHVIFLLLSVLYLYWWNVSILASIEKKLVLKLVLRWEGSIVKKSWMKKLRWF